MRPPNIKIISSINSTKRHSPIDSIAAPIACKEELWKENLKNWSFIHLNIFFDIIYLSLPFPLYYSVSGAGRRAIQKWSNPRRLVLFDSDRRGASTSQVVPDLIILNKVIFRQYIGLSVHRGVYIIPFYFSTKLSSII